MWISSTGFVTGQKIGVGKWTYIYTGRSLRYFMPGIVKSNLMELNRTQSVDWVRLSSAIERNRTPDFQWVRFPNKSNSSHKSNSIEHNLMDWVRLALVNLYKASPKQAHQSRFYNLFNNRNPIYKLSTAVKRNRTEQSYHYSRGRIPKLLYPFLF